MISRLRCSEGVPVQGRGEGGGAYSFVARLSHLTIDHAILSRRSTVPTPTRDTHLQHLGAHYASSICYMETVSSYPRPVSPSGKTGGTLSRNFGR